MFTLLKSLYIKAEGIKGRKLLFLIVSLFVVCLVVGLLIGYFTNRILTNDEGLANTGHEESVSTEPLEVSYEGKIRYVDPHVYPEDGITYTLVDDAGKEVILLKARDQILSVAENQFVTVYGTVSQTQSGNQVLMVDRLSFKNVTN